MAWNAVKALERLGDDPNAAVVVLVGSGHVAYGLGIERQARTYLRRAHRVGDRDADRRRPGRAIPVGARVVRQLHLGRRARGRQLLAVEIIFADLGGG